MRFRILAGADMVRATPTDDRLEVAIKLDSLRVEVGEGVQRFAGPQGRTTLLVGSLVGHRDSSSGKLQSPDDVGGLLNNLIDGSSSGEWTQRLEGDAVVMVVDENGTLVLGGDRYFKRDVFVQQCSGGVALSSDLDLLPENPARDGYDNPALAHTLTYYGGRPPKRHTIYRSARRLGIGDTAVISDGRLEVSTSPFAAVQTEDYGEPDLERYYDAFMGSIEAAGSSEGNCLFLSSGWDSSSILAGLAQVFGPEHVCGVIGRMHYSTRSGNCNRIEIERAERIAAHYGVRLHMVDLDYVNSGPDWIERVRDTFKAHNIQSQTGLNHARLADGAATAGPGWPVFAGEISDGAHNLGFSQYVTIFHPTQGFREYSDKMASYLFGPTFIREFLAGRHEEDAVFRLFRQRAGDTLFDEPANGRKAKMRQMLVSFFLRNGRTPFWSGRNSRILTPEGLDQYTNEMSAAYFAGIEEAEPEEIYSWYLHLYNSFHWQGSTVSTIQKMGDLFGLSAHNPFWDGALQDFLYAMPEAWGRGLTLTPTKYPLKRMMQEKLDFPMDLLVGPHSYTYDVDPTFNHSFELMHHSALGPYAKDILRHKPYHEILAEDCFDLAYIDGIVDTFLSGEEQHGAALNDLVSIWLLCQTGWYSG
jgi:hypothetical protein